MENKSFKGLIWLIILLIILVISLIALVVYKGFFADNNSLSEDNTTITTSSTTTTKVNEETLSDEELEKYLSYVPLTQTYENDAYSGKTINFNNINKEILMEQIYINTTKETGVIDIQHKMCGDMGSCEADNYVLVSNFEKTAKKMYNYDELTLTSFNIAGAVVTKSGNYYAALYGKGADSLEKISKVISSHIINKDLIILEQTALLREREGEVFLYRYSDDDIFVKNEITYDTEEYEEIITNMKKYAIDKIEDFPIYKHTFKNNEEGNYYWYSTEVIENDENYSDEN